MLEKLTWGAIAILTSIVIAGTAFSAEKEHNGKGFGWQDREYSGRAEMELDGGEAASADSGDAGAAAGASSGATGGDSGGEGDGCGR